MSMRQYCKECDQYSLVVAGEFQCCDSKIFIEQDALESINFILYHRPVISGIYKIYNKQTKKVYIGQSNSIFSRLTVHVNRIKKLTHEIDDINGDCKLHGFNSFTFEVLIIDVPEENLLYKEAEIMDIYKKSFELYNRMVPSLELKISDKFKKLYKERQKLKKLAHEKRIKN